jgi:hypothetical protein
MPLTLMLHASPTALAAIASCPADIDRVTGGRCGGLRAQEPPDRGLGGLALGELPS